MSIGFGCAITYAGGALAVQSRFAVGVSVITMGFGVVVAGVVAARHTPYFGAVIIGAGICFAGLGVTTITEQRGAFGIAALWLGIAVFVIGVNIIDASGALLAAVIMLGGVGIAAGGISILYGAGALGAAWLWLRSWVQDPAEVYGSQRSLG